MESKYDPEHDDKQSALTRKLLAEGWTKEHFPDYISEYNWFYGGFVYTVKAKLKMTFKTPCGLFVKYDSIFEGMSYMGIDWSIEDEHAVCHCPYYTRARNRCALNNDILDKPYRCSRGEEYLKFCTVSQTDEPYDYEKSVEKQFRTEEEIEEQIYEEFKEKKKGHICRWMIIYNRNTRKIRQIYDPCTCMHNNCDFCTLRQKEMTGKKAHIVYDTEIVWFEKGEGLLPDSEKTIVRKNIKYTSRPIYEPLALAIYKKLAHEIEYHAKMKYHVDMFFGRIKSFRVLNIRIERKLKHDIYEDLELIREGVHISYADIEEKQKKQRKHEHTQKAKEKRFNKMIQLYIQHGYEGLGEFQYRFNKLVDSGKLDIEELDEQKAEYLQKQSEEETAQLSFFDDNE